MRKFSKFTPDEDAPLLLSWYRGDISAFETLVWKYLKRVYSLAYYLTGNYETAATAAQDAFIAAFVNINSFSSRFHFSDWLIALTLKETRDLLDYRDPVMQEGKPKSSGLQELLTEQLLQLPHELAEVLVLCNVRGYSLERISDICQLRTDYLIARLFDAHEMLGAQVRKERTLPGKPLTSGAEKIFPHPEIRLSFHAYLDSSLSVADAENIRKHLKSCGSCREALTGLEWIIEHLKELPDIDPPHWLTVAIMQKVKITPPPPENVRKAPIALHLQLGAGLLFSAIIALSAYLLQADREKLSQVVSGRAPERKAVTPSPQSPQRSEAADFITSITAPFRSTGKPVATEVGAAVPTVPLPQPAPAAEKVSAPAPSPGITPAETPVKNEAAGKRNRIERSPELPPEWGETLPPGRIQQKKAAPVRSRSSEIAVEMVTEDPLAAIREVENAVSELGGKITGRAYSSGSDILYTRIDVDRFFDLMSRLGKAGRIQELPQPPEGAQGTVDLIIKWH